MNKSTITTSVLGFAVVAALLTGCSAPAADLIPATPAKTAAAVEPTEAPAEAPAAAATKTGDVVDAAQAKVILKAGEGQRGYPMADGTFVVVTKTEPLPANVQADMEAKSSAAVAVNGDVTVDRNAHLSALYASAGSIGAGTGKRVISVWPLVGYPFSDSESKVGYWNVTGGPAPAGEQFNTRDEAAAFIDAWLSQQANANEYAVVYAG